MTTKAQVEANRKNAAKSTGPRTAEGKKRARLNGLKHGLRAEEVVLPGEDAEGFRDEVAGWLDDWRPRSHTAAVLAERAAVASWRLRRCVRAEAFRLADCGKDEVRRHDEHARGRVREAVKMLGVDAPRALTTLGSEYEGVAALIGLWESLADAATGADGWSEPAAHHARLLNLLGFPGTAEAEEVGDLAIASWRLVIRARPDIAEDDFGSLDDDQADRLAEALGRCIAERIATLRRSLSRFADPDDFREDVAARGQIDNSARGRLLARYEASHERSLRTCIAQLLQIQKSGIEFEDDEPADEPDAPNEAIGPKSLEDREFVETDRLDIKESTIDEESEPDAERETSRPSCVPGLYAPPARVERPRVSDHTSTERTSKGSLACQKGEWGVAAWEGQPTGRGPRVVADHLAGSTEEVRTADPT